MRTNSVEKLKSLIIDVIPGAEVKCFGSFHTKLYLPNADIDMVIVKEDGSNNSMY